MVYDFTETRAGEHARAFLRVWRGSLVCYDYIGYKASFALGVTEAGCMAHARRKFIDLHEANKARLRRPPSSSSASCTASSAK